MRNMSSSSSGWQIVDGWLKF